MYNDVVECAVKNRILFAIQRKVLERQSESRGTEAIAPKFEAIGHKVDGKILAPARDINRRLDTQKLKNKILFPMAKYKNEEKLPDYQSFTTDKLVDLLHENARTKQKNNNWSIFVQDIDKNKIHLFEDLPPTTKIIDLKASVNGER